MNDGFELRQMAELGLAVISLEYNQTNETGFPAEMSAVQQYLAGQKWADTNAIAWVGFSLGANRMLDYALKYPERQPQLIVQVSGCGLDPAFTINPPYSHLHCATLLVHAEQDEIFPLAGTVGLASLMQSNGLPVELKIIPGASHGLSQEQGVVFRSIGEYCLGHLDAKGALENYHSIARWQAGAPRLWLFWLPAAVWGIGWFVWARQRKVALAEKIKLKRHEIVLRWLAALLAVWALTETAIHLITPHLTNSDRTLATARRYLVQAKERADFEYLATQPIGRGQKLKALLDHVELAGYNRQLVNWSLDDLIYREQVLQPVIISKSDEALNWRRPLWEEFYPRIRHESSMEDAARIVVRHLRERVTIATLPDLPRDIPAIWLRQITDAAGFEIIYVAALRSIGIPARLDGQGQTEFWDGSTWKPAPKPAVTSFLW